MPPRIEPLTQASAVIGQLSSLLIETVANGGSVSFMHPLDPATAQAFWQASLAAVADGKRLVLGAFAGEILTGTVTLALDCPENQPHRAEICKLMVGSRYRGQGIGSALMRAAEEAARARSRTLLVLDTAEEGGAAAFYEQLGYQLTGLIPDYALKPHGSLTGTLIYWKRLTSDYPPSAP